MLAAMGSARGPAGRVGTEELLVHSEWLQRLARGLVADDVADDITQQVWLASMRRPPRREDLRAWLRTVVRNLIRSEQRTQRRRRAREVLVGLGEPQTTTSCAEDLLLRGQLQRFLMDEIGRLKAHHRETVLLRYFDGLSASAIAGLLGIPAGTVRRRLKEGLDRLRRALDDYDRDQDQDRGRRSWVRVLLPVAFERGSSLGAPGGTGHAAAAIADSGSGGATAGRTSPRATIVGRGRVAFMGASLVACVVLTVIALVEGPGGVEPASRDGSSAPAFRAAAVHRSVRVGPPALSPDRGASAVGTGVVEGSVRGADGRPAAGVIVTLAARAASERLAIATTDWTGGYRFAEVAPGGYGLTAVGAGGWGARELPPLRAGAVLRADLSLRGEAFVLEGRVLDAGSGTVIPHAEVSAWPDSYPWLPEQAFATRADGNGRYRLALPARRYAMFGRAAGYAENSLWHQVSGAAVLDVHLQPTGRITGQVVERSSRRPVGDDMVMLSQDGLEPRQTAVDASGTFQIAVAPGTYRLWSRRGGLFGLSPPVTVRPAETSTIQVLLEPTPVLTGRVAAADGRAIAGALVSASAGGACQGLYTSTAAGADGRYELPAPPSCDLVLAVEAEGFAASPPRSSAAASGGRRLDLVLQPEALLRGQIRGGDGAPVAGARVSARVGLPGRPAAAPGQRRVPEHHRTVTSDPAGRFELRGLPAGQLWLAAQSDDGAAASLGPQTVAAGEVRDVDLSLSPPASLSGRILFDDGAPAAGVRVDAAADRDGADFGFFASTVSDEQGRFTVGPLGAGTVSVQLGWRSFLAVRHRRLPVGLRPHRLDVHPGEHRAGLVFTVPRPTSKLAGSVVDGAGDAVPAAAVDVYLRDPEGRTLAFANRVFTDPTGRFEVPDLLEPPDQTSHVIHAQHPALGGIQIRGGSPGGAPLVLRLPGHLSRP
jgi:RNA polymerase sigma-70 factor (ECF subfamily)